MGVSAPEVTVENILNTGFANIIANASTYLPLIFQNFPTDYQNEAIEYITGPNFKVQTVFGYAYDPSLLPLFNIALAQEGEGTAASKQMYLGDEVDPADQNPNTVDFEQHGSLWSSAVSIIVRTQKARQTIILYAMVKWLMLKNRVPLETAGVMATKFSGTDLSYDASKTPTFVFSRTFKMDCLVMNTWDLDITSDPEIADVISGLGTEVRVLPESQITLG